MQLCNKLGGTIALVETRLSVWRQLMYERWRKHGGSIGMACQGSSERSISGVRGPGKGACGAVPSRLRRFGFRSFPATQPPPQHETPKWLPRSGAMSVATHKLQLRSCTSGPRGVTTAAERCRYGAQFPFHVQRGPEPSASIAASPQASLL